MANNIIFRVIKTLPSMTLLGLFVFQRLKPNEIFGTVTDECKAMAVIPRKANGCLTDNKASHATQLPHKHAKAESEKRKIS